MMNPEIVTAASKLKKSLKELLEQLDDGDELEVNIEVSRP
jgi:hypothetical protein